MAFAVITSGKPPTIQIYNPQNEQLVSETVEIVAEVESQHPLCYVKVSFDEGDSWNLMSRKEGDDYVGKYTFDWNTEKDSNGNQRILVKALDTFGRSDSCAVVVNVFNGENAFLLSSYSLQVQPSPIDSSETNQTNGIAEDPPFTMYWITPGNNSFHNEFVEIEVLVAEQDSYIDEIWYRVINETASAKGDVVVENTSLPISRSFTELNVSSWNDDTIYRIEAFSSNIFGANASLSGKYSMYFIKGNTSITDRTPPKVEILEPEDEAVVYGIVTIDGYAFDDNLDTVWIEIRNSSDYLLVNQTLSSPSYDYEWNTTNLPHGFYFVTLFAIDTNGNLASHSIYLIDPLTATLINPTDGSYVSGDSVSISFTATEETEAWVTVESIDGLTIYWEWPLPHDTSSAHSYSYIWDSTIVPADGDYNIVAHVSNGTDTFNDTNTVTVDNTPPGVSNVQVSPVAGQPGTTFTITAQVSDTLSGVSSVTAYIQFPDETNIAIVTLYDDGAHSDGAAGDGTYGNTWNSAGRSEGEYYVDIVATDNAGSSGETENGGSFIIDNTPPAVSIVQVSPAAGQPGTTFTITAQVSDTLSSVSSVTAYIQFPDETDIATVTLYDDGAHSDGAAGDGTYGNTWDSTGQASGVYYVDIVAVNTAGNSGETENVTTFTVDGTPPATAVILSGTLGLAGWYVSDVTVTLTATDGLSGVADTAYSFDGITWNTYTGPFSITTEGSTTVYYNSTDNLGNLETTKIEIIQIDKTSPATTIILSGTLGLAGWYVSDVTVTLTATDGTSGVAGTAYSFDGTTWNTYTGPFSITTEGSTTVYYNSTDNAGNVETTKTQIIQIDKTPPAVSNVQVSPAAGQPGTTFTITAQVSDTLSTISSVTAYLQFPDETNIATVTLYDDGAHSDGAAGDGTYGNTWDSSGQAVGTYYVDIVATDILGNSGETENGDTFIIDDTPPAVSNVQVTPAAGQPGTTFTITAQVSDTLSTISSVTAYIQFPDETNIATVTLYDDGAHSDGAAGDGTYGNIWDSTGQASGVYYVDIVAVDTAGNSGETENGDTFIIDDIPPGVTNVQVTPATGQPGTTFILTAQVSDTLSTISSVTAYIQFPDETNIATVTLYDDGAHSDGAAGDGTYGNTWDSSGQASGVYYVDIVAVDTLSNSGETENGATFTVDGTPPAVSNVQVTPSTGQPGTTFTITAQVSDTLSTISSVTAYLQFPDETNIATVTLYDDGSHSDGTAGDGTYGNTWDSSGQASGVYYVDVVAVDTLSNSGETENAATFTVDGTPPAISNVQVTPSTGQPGTTFTITAQVS
ncbi:MAG: beta strand repeat-containing protein, partial [Promethearchaeota archaeon]